MNIISPSPLVVMVANYPKGTGYAWWLMERFWDEIAFSAQQRGWSSIVVYPENLNNNAEDNAMDISQLETFLTKGTLGDYHRIHKLIKHYNIRSLYLTDRPFRSWRYFLLRMVGVNSIVVHDHTPGDRPAVNGVRGVIKRLLNSCSWFTATLSIAISPLMYQRQLRNARIPAARIATVTNGIELRDCIVNARERLIKNFRLPQDAYIVCLVGRLNAYKRFDFAIHCMSRLTAENPKSNSVLLIVGDGPERERLQNLAESMSSGCQVIFTGQTDQVWSMLCGIDVVMHPSKGEGLSLAILEAMSAAKPVIVPDVPSVSQTIDDKVDGFIYKDGSVDDATKVLKILLDDVKLRHELGKNARDKVQKYYQIERMMKDFRSRVITVIFENSSNI